MNNNCVDCAPGSYYDRSSRECVLCDFGSYQNEFGQIECKLCPEIAGQPSVTKTKGSTTIESCKEKCAAGRFFDETVDECRSCGHGFYQSEAGMFKCRRCPRGQTTQTKEAVSSLECSDECESGLQLVPGGNCKMCPEGTFRQKGIHAACVLCPPGKTTSQKGAVEESQCSVPICLSGTYYNISSEVCVTCPQGTYQPQSKQRECVKCPSGTWTSTEGSTSESDCKNACAAQGERMSCHSDADCIEVERNTFVCQCKVGFLGNGTYCKGMFFSSKFSYKL